MRQLVSRFGRLPIAPFAIPVMVCAPIWEQNIHRLTYQHMLPTLLVLLAITAVLLSSVRLFVKSWMRSSLISLIWVGYMLYLQATVGLFTDASKRIFFVLAVGPSNVAYFFLNHLGIWSLISFRGFVM